MSRSALLSGFGVVSACICLIFPVRILAQEPLAPSRAPSTQEQNCGVAGKVLRKGTDEPIHFARVTLRGNSDESKRLHAVTGSDGKFIFRDVPCGEYRLSVSRNGYVQEFYGGRRTLESSIPLMDQGIPLTLEPAKRVDDLVFRMTRAGLIGGHVRDENGEALPGAEVMALLSTFVSGKRTLVPASVVAANDLGEYRLYNLPPGKYLLSAGFESISARGLEFAGMLAMQEEREGLLTTYYPGTADPSQATSLEVEPGGELRSIDFTLQPSGVFHIRGHVRGLSSGNGGLGGAVMLRKGNSKLTTMMPEKPATVNAKDGSFDIDEVGSGSYDLIAFEFSENSPRFAHQPIEVHGSDVEGVELTFEPAATVPGHLRWDDPSAGKDVSLEVSLEEEETLFGRPPSAEVQPDGSFELKGVSADNCSVNVTGAAPDAYLKSAQYGSADALGIFRISSGSSASLELTVGARGAHIKGTVMNSDPVPVAGVSVTLIPEETKHKVKRLFQSVKAGANGKFEFRGIAPGTYDLYAWDNVAEHEWEDPDFLRPYKSKAISITVSEGDTRSIDLTTIRSQKETESRP